jgi:hypothetical protein
VKARSIHEPVAFETPELIDRLADAPFPTSEKLIGAVLLKAHRRSLPWVSRRP